MRISHRHRFVFISKPKCATTSMRKLLDPYSDVFSGEKYPFHHHAKAFELKMHFDEVGWQWDEYFRFMTIRNPWAMVVSWFTYAKPDRNGHYWYQPNLYDPSELMSFDDWVTSPRTYHRFRWEDGELKERVWRNDFSGITAEEYALDRDGDRLVDRILRSEHLEEELPEICERIGIPYQPPETLNTTQHRPYREYYNDRSRQYVASQFEYDIELGKYQF